MPNSNYTIANKFDPQSTAQTVTSNLAGLLQLILNLKKDSKTTNNTTHNEQYQTLVNNTKISIEAIKQEQQQRQKELEKLAEQINQTKDKKEHDFLLNELKNQKENLKEEKKIITKISHAVQREDFEDAAKEAGIFAENGTVIYDTPSPATEINTNWLNPTPKQLNKITLQPLGGDTSQIRRYTPAPEVMVKRYVSQQPINISLPKFQIKSTEITDAIANNISQYLTPEQLKHKRAETYKQLCLISDKIATASLTQSVEGLIVFDGYEVVNAEYDRRTNFKAVTYKKGNEIVNCFVGTDPKSAKDQKANLQMGFGHVTEQMDKANEYTEAIAKRYNKTFKIINAGHSEGGSEAIYSGLYNGLETYTYNTFAPSKTSLNKLNKERNLSNHNKLITNYRDPHDPISKLFNQDIGQTYIVENQQSAFMAKSPFGAKQAHSLAMMGDCNTATPIREYKRKNPWFIDKIGLVKLTNQDIAEIYEAGLFEIYEEEIDKRLKLNDIIPEDMAQSLVRQGLLEYFEGHFEYLTD
ncbi:hypothetical protein DBY21_03160 [Candidatus Gastranaerophilales bacterium]|nr:MAG: hypothetical protein DBY21_03160 [Candidatus Gastranaerophilales bacterium]